MGLVQAAAGQRDNAELGQVMPADGFPDIVTHVVGRAVVEFNLAAATLNAAAALADRTFQTEGLAGL